MQPMQWFACRSFGTLRSYPISCLIKKETGKNIQEHIHYKLIEAAKDCLCFNDKSISQIAYELGFEYPQHFTRLFKSKVGVTPSEYRQMKLVK